MRSVLLRNSATSHRVAELLDKDPSLVNKLPDYVSYYSGYALRNAAGAGHLATVQLLLDRGADPNFPELDIAPWGGALHAAIGGNHRQIVQLLLEHGANPNAAVESSGNCMSRAKYSNAPPELINLLALHGAAQTVELLCYYNNLGRIGAGIPGQSSAACATGSTGRSHWRRPSTGC